MSEITSPADGTGLPTYAVIFGTEHLKQARDNGQLPLSSILECFLSDMRLKHSPFFNWISFLNVTDTLRLWNVDDEPRGKLLSALSDPSNPIFWASLYGFHDIYEIVSAKFDLQQLNVEMKSPLWVACRHGSYMTLLFYC
jgi:hypothetical protein